ncbi:dynein regulatory complex subunit 2-like [Atheta coriaria]|uniref:dynein regulatory complex subunit 2-like n=1 Tax=Dalotia coriaria TaxID=877792 RepID=UPI0031F33E9C
MPPKRNRSKSPQKTKTKKAKLAEKHAAKVQHDRDILVETEHDHIYREIKYGSECVRKHEKNWRDLLIKIAQPQMRVTVECAMHHFERAIDSKDFEISLLLDELTAADTQYVRSVSSHIDDIDRIIVLCYDQIAELWQESGNMISNLYRAANQERSEVMHIDNEHEIYLRTMLFQFAENSRKLGRLMRYDYLSRQEVEVSRFTEEATKFNVEWKDYSSKLWDDAEEFMQKYKRDFARRKRQCEELNKTDADMQIQLAMLQEKAREAYNTMDQLKTKHELIQSTLGKKVQELVLERDYYKNIAIRLKTNEREARNIDQEKLTALSLICNDVLAFVKACEKQGENLLSLCGLCSKFETENEKFLRFPTFENSLPQISAEEKSGLTLRPPRRVRKSTTIDILRRSYSEEVVYLNELQLFWLRYGAVETQRLQIQEESARLREENDRLKKTVFNYCECLSCDQDLDYLYVNNRYSK